jgi:trimeric autotransporter adhesin
MKISLEEKPMPGDQSKKNYKRLLSVTLSALCLINLLAPMIGPASQPVNAQAQGAFNLNQCSANQSFEATMFAVTTDNRLLNFNPGSPGIINSTINITGLGQGENIVGIDFRAANGQLYALTSASRLYIINPTSGAATPVGATLATAVNGANFGFDFNPTVDRIRVVSNADQNLRLNPNNAAVAGMDGTLAFATAAVSSSLTADDVNAGQNPNIVAEAYTNNFAGSTVTTLYGIDSARDVLVTQGSLNSAPISPNSGQLLTVGPLGVDAGDVVGFDIAPVTNAAFAAITPPGGGVSTLYTINLATGATVSLGPINARQSVTDIAFAVRAENAFAVTASNRLIKFNPGLPGAINNSIPISGIGGENIVGIDFRPATGVLFALSDASRIYTINTANGIATPVGGPTATALNGANFGFDFNPTVDRIRLTSDADQDLRLVPGTAAIAGIDGTLAYATGDVNAVPGQDPNIVGSAYTANFLGSPATTLYNIDSNLNTLVTQGTAVGVTPAVGPNTGQLFTVGPLGVDANAVLGFDISSESGAAFASINTDAGGATQIYQINLMTGAATSLGAVGVNEVVRDIAIEVRLPNVIALTASNLLVHFNAATPGLINMIRVIRGLPRRERLVAIDFRPAAGYLYALSASNRAYLIVLSDPARALAVRLQNINPALNGANFGFDFNPVPDLIRLTSDADQNLRVNPNTGAVAGTDGALSFAAGDPNAGANPMIVGSAYTNSFLGAKTTTLYGIDAGLGALVTQGSVGGAPISPNTGQLFTVGNGSLGVPTGTSVGFDIASPTNAAFASFTPSGANQSQFYNVNLNTGVATLIGGINLRETVTGITLGGVARQGFDICLQDDRTGSTLQFDSCTGDYQFSKCGAGAFVQTGRGNTSIQNNVLTLRANNVFAIVNINPGSSLRSGTAVVRAGRVFTVNDNNSADNTCGCR